MLDDQTAGLPLADRVPVAVVGASAGGLEALRALFAPMPTDTGIAFVVIQHRLAGNESLLADLIAQATRLPVTEGLDGTLLRTDEILLVPAGCSATIKEKRLCVEQARDGERRGTLPIDQVLFSLALDVGDAGIAVILSGGGSDGTNGLRAVKEAGGLVLVQDPVTAEMDSMPRNAIETGMADFILPAGGIAGTLSRYVQESYLNGTPIDAAERSSRAHVLSQIIALLLTRTKLSFTHYKRGTLARRVERRMGIHHLKTFNEYLTLLQSTTTEPAALAQDLLISVTRFFRDPDSFETLCREVIEPLVRSGNGGNPVRVWIPGCATGEEAYSIAMLLLEAGAGGSQGPEIKIFATDVDDRALDVARAGRYPEATVADVSPDRIARFFTQENGVYHVRTALREAVVFAPQNLLVDPPFSQLDLISCRNLMIYIEPEAQRRLIPMFHFALNEGGYLFLGNAETTGGRSDLFQPISAKLRVFQRVGTGRSRMIEVPSTDPVGMAPYMRTRVGAHRPGAAEIIRQALITEFAPPSVLVDQNNQVLYFHGAIAEVLDIPTGEPRTDLLAMTSGDLRVQLREALQLAQAEGSKVVRPGVRSSRAGMVRTFQLVVFPIKGGRMSHDRLIAVSFLLESDRAAPSPVRPEEETVVVQLERELRITREDLHSTIQDLETANEALIASNEEITSMNEELQSANEELETSKEELQSLNEELSTVNSQLQDKVSELELFGNDLANLLNSTNLPTIFLDQKYRVRRFTPSAVQVFALIASDIGRPITDVVRKFEDPGFLDDVHRVLKDLLPIEAQVMTDDGLHLIRRMLPYRTQENRIEGVVVTFTDVTQSVQAGQLVAARARQHAIIAEISSKALSGLSTDDLIRDAVKAVAATLEADCAALFEPSSDGLIRLDAAAGPISDRLRDRTFSSDPATDVGQAMAIRMAVRVQDFAAERQLRPPPGLASGGVASGIAVPCAGPQPAVLAVYDRRAGRFGDEDQRFLEALASVLGLAFERHSAEQAMTSARDFARDIVDTQRIPLLLLDQSNRIVSASAAYFASFSTTPEAVLGRALIEIGGGVWDLPELRSALAAVQRDARPMLGLAIDWLDDEIGKRSFILDILALNHTPDVIIIGISDVTIRKREADELAQAKQDAETASMAKSRFLAAASHDLRQPLQGALLFHDLALQHNSAPDVTPFLNRLGLTLHALQQMLDTILDISKLDAGVVDAKPRAVRLDTVIERLAAEFRPQAEMAGLRMVVVCSSPYVRTDPTLMERILRNLIANAIRYTERGGILVGCRAAGDSVKVQIWDTGRGIAADQLDVIFQEFHQLGNPSRDRQKGLGLGLAIVRRLSTLLGQPVTVRSTPGRGSVFEMIVPRAEEPSASPTHQEAEPSAATADRSVIILIEDDPYILEGIGEVLAGEGHEVVSMADAARLVDHLKGIDPDHIRCIISDFRLPSSLNGVEAIKRLRKILGRRISGILITGDTSPERLQEARASGFTLLHKPVNRLELLAAVKRAQTDGP